MGKLNFIPKIELTKEEYRQLEEQYIFKQFEDLGYVFREHNQLFIIESPIHRVRIWINKDNKNYWAGQGDIDMKIHWLLHKLFELWGWFDE